MASVPPEKENPNNPKPPKVREEGELTSDDDALPTGSATQTTSISAPPSSSLPNAAAKTPMHSLNLGKGSASMLGSAGNQSQTPAYRKGLSKNQVLLKSSNPAWRASGVTDNLVISFSDDEDSGSDGEERRHGKTLAGGRLSFANSSKKPLALPHVKPLSVRRIPKSEGKVAPKKASLSRTFISSMSNIHGPRASNGGSLSEQRSSLKSSNTSDRLLASQDPGCSKNMDVSISKLQDLRKQIAMRENELKLKLVQQNKESGLESCRKVNAMDQNQVSSRKGKAVPADIETDFHPMEPDRKRLKLDAAGVTVSCSLSDWISGPRDTVQLPKHTLSSTKVTVADTSDKSNPGMVNNNLPSRSASNQDTHENNRSKVNDHQESVSMRDSVKFKSESSLKARSLQISDSKSESHDASPDDVGQLHSLGGPAFCGSGDLDLQSLLELEELHDKELEEAQEQRRRYEEEERNALKAYRKAQRALAEANARCTYLYSRRELYSAQLRSVLMENTSLYSFRQPSQLGGNWNCVNNVSEINFGLISSGQQLHDEFDAGNQLGYDSNVHSADGDVHNRFSAKEDGHHLGSEACSEPDGSTSELVRGNNSAAHGFCSPSSDPNLSPDDYYETFPQDHKSDCADMTCVRKEDNAKECEKSMDIDSTTNFSMDFCRDPLLLEDYLRSKLVARLGVSSSRGSKSNSTIERAVEHNVACAENQIMADRVLLSEYNHLTVDCGEPLKESDCNMLKPPVIAENQQHIEDHPLGEPQIPCSDEDSRFCLLDVASSSTFRSTMKAVGPLSSDNSQIQEHHCGFPVMCNGDVALRESQDELICEKESFAQQHIMSVSFGRIESYTCGSAIDHFWPLCMYELRGRCNDEECPWQHAKDFSSGNMKQSHNSGANDCETGWSANSLNQRGRGEVSGVLTPPRYVVCMDSLKDDSCTSGSLQARHFASSRKNIFSYALAVSSSLLKHLPSSEPCLHGNDGCVESYGSGGHSLFRSRNGIGNSLQSGTADSELSLEMALSILSQEVNKLEGMKKALSVLSRALEAESASLHLWIIYLLLYYSTKNKVRDICGHDLEVDFFSHAVKHNEQSYELWLLYINSRKQLSERFAAYERALSRLCHHASTTDGHTVLKSSAFLDLLLQMLHCFCVSGNVAKAVQKIYELAPDDRDFDESHSLLLSDVLQYLTISDKCIFWVCCVYLVIYRKLPDFLVQQFELEKDLSVLEWPSVRVSPEEELQVSKLLTRAIESVGLCMEHVPYDISTLKSAQPLVVNSIKIMAAIGDTENCTMYVEKFKVAYSSCVDFVLVSVRAHGSLFECINFEGFEKALLSWPNDAPGSQCIWNQFAEYALEKNRLDKAKEIMDQWFHCIWEPQMNLQPLVVTDGGNCIKSSSVDSLSGLHTSVLAFDSSNMDLVFGLLNLSLYKLLQSDVLEAQIAIDKALKIADADGLRHCVREHAAFLLNHGSKMGKDVSVCGLLGTLKGYTINLRAIPASDPLTRKFVQDIQKPRSRQLVSSILSPMLPDSVLVNSILEIWYGSSLLPQKFDELKDMVDFVEAILEVSPANYQLVVSACKLLSRDSDTACASVLFWASSLLVNTIYQAVPVPPEYIWVEAACLLGKLTKVLEILESFHERALSVCPFSIKLWKSYLSLSMDPSKKSSAIEEARQKGLELG